MQYTYCKTIPYVVRYCADDKAKTGTASTIWRSLAVKGKNFGGRIAKLSVIVKI